MTPDEPRVPRDDAASSSRKVECPECHGNGFPPDYPNRTCPMCFGKGWVTEVRRGCRPVYAAAVAAGCAEGDGGMSDTTTDLLPVGTPIRHRRHHELTGRIKGHERNQSGALSPIPYCIEWDDSGRAGGVLGFLFVYGTDESVEAVA